MARLFCNAERHGFVSGSILYVFSSFWFFKSFLILDLIDIEFLERRRSLKITMLFIEDFEFQLKL